MDKRKTRTTTTRKMGKLDHNHERAQTEPHNEHIQIQNSSFYQPRFRLRSHKLTKIYLNSSKIR
jgi:hypothetical protein